MIMTAGTQRMTLLLEINMPKKEEMSLDFFRKLFTFGLNSKPYKSTLKWLST